MPAGAAPAQTRRCLGARRESCAAASAPSYSRTRASRKVLPRRRALGEPAAIARGRWRGTLGRRRPGSASRPDGRRGPVGAGPARDSGTGTPPRDRARERPPRRPHADRIRPPRRPRRLALGRAPLALDLSATANPVQVSFQHPPRAGVLFDLNSGRVPVAAQPTAAPAHREPQQDDDRAARRT